ncbi:MAG TPA: amidohydrolase family protein, partial [Flexilinea sp.]|nr:amidohydrolase family protein [Flexilinea sp.]
PQKGSLEVGTDADIVVVDMDAEYIMDQEKLHSRTKLTPFNGLKMKGKVDATFLRGKKIVEHGEMIAEPGGKFIRPNKK